MGQSAPAAAWGRGLGSLWNVSSRELGTPPSLSAPNPICVPSSPELTGPPLAGTHHHPSPSHPRPCPMGTQQKATSRGCGPACSPPSRARLIDTLNTGRASGLCKSRLAQVTRRQNSNPEKMLASSCHSSGRAAPGCSGLGNKTPALIGLQCLKF